MRLKLAILVPALLVIAVVALRSHSQPVQPDLKNVMKAKLAHTHSILEGLALEDFNRVLKGAQNLSALSRADAWNVHKTPEYVKFSKDFQAVADSLAANAKTKKLEACTLDYVQLTMLCVKCHTHTRKIGVATGDKSIRDILASGR